ncbi:MAG TPA: hypothetical protein VL972_06140, partial [Solirubrobacteraceae bacterium]|nr:hypothetical protein [Solirubrobacteraceae bacterium]
PLDQADEGRILHHQVPMPRRKPKAHELTTEEAVRRMFPKPAREAVRSEAKKTRKPARKPSTSRKPS